MSRFLACVGVLISSGISSFSEAALIKKWTVIPGGCLALSNTKMTGSTDVEDCQRKCEEETGFTCLSIDKRLDSGLCILSRESRATKPAHHFESPCGDPNPFSYADFAEIEVPSHSEDCEKPPSQFHYSISHEVKIEGDSQIGADIALQGKAALLRCALSCSRKDLCFYFDLEQPDNLGPATCRLFMGSSESNQTSSNPDFILGALRC